MRSTSTLVLSLTLFSSLGTALPVGAGPVQPAPGSLEAEAGSDDAAHLAAPGMAPLSQRVAGPAPATQDATAQALDQGLWDLVKDSKNPEDLKEYLKRFPNGNYALFARRNLEALTKSQAPSAPAAPAVTALGATSPPATGTVMTVKDCAFCSEMVIFQPGSFLMGSSITEPGREKDEEPHQVDIRVAFAIAKHEVTFQEWDICRSEGGCNGYSPPDQGWGRGRKPVINVSWNDAQAYIIWLNNRLGLTGRPDRFRLPTEAEWEYAARSGGKPFDPMDVTPMRVNYKTDNKETFRGQTVIVGSLPANAAGLHEMLGNVREWVEDCYGSYAIAPTNGSAALTGTCAERIRRGGSWNNPFSGVRPGNRAKDAAKDKGNDLGFRLARYIQ